MEREPQPSIEQLVLFLSGVGTTVESVVIISNFVKGKEDLNAWVAGALFGAIMLVSGRDVWRSEKMSIQGEESGPEGEPTLKD